VATPIIHPFTRTYSRRNLGSLVNPPSDPEKVLRVWLNKLHSIDHLNFLGQEALLDIHLFFINYPINPDIMGDFYMPCNFTNIQG